ncbi:MAG: hypothetical protein EP343_13170 [Deltaproteobacteria bacterium]|nr:MAG: hypothetical protein EP343_13170 [Deltaproteobacteria bacterium]
MSVHLTTPVWKHSWPYLLLATFTVLGATYLRSFLSSRTVFARAETLLHDGALEGAIRQYGRTIRWYTPGNRYTLVAAQRLLKISDLSYQQGKWEQAIMALQHLRNALSAIRSVYQPYPTLLKRCQVKLAESFTHLSPGKTAVQQATFKKQLLHMFQETPGPSSIRTFFAALMYLLWLGSMALLLWFWGRFSTQQRVAVGMLHLISLVTWMAALMG